MKTTTSGTVLFAGAYNLIRTLGSVAVLLVAFPTFLSANTNAPLNLRISVSGSGEQRATELRWTSIPMARYLVQTRDTLDEATPWQTIDMVQPPGTNGLFLLAPDKLEAGAEGIRRNRFFQIAPPVPDIFTLEPSVLPPTGGVMYLTGQCLDPNGVLRIETDGGFIDLPATEVSSGVWRVNVPALPPGRYTAKWSLSELDASKSAQAFSVGNDIHFGQRLLEPPVTPAGVPFFKSVTGLDLNIDALEIQEGGMNTGARKLPGARSAGIARSTAELRVEEVDLAIPGRGLDFVFQRTYRSRTAPSNSTMGIGWSHSYEIRVGNWNSASGHFDLWDGSGRIDTFFRGTNGIYSRDEIFSEGSVSNTTFTLTFADSGKWIFHPLDGSAQAGKIARIEDRNGNAMLLHYDGQGRCAQIVDTLDRTNTLAYSPDGFVSAVTDFTGRSVRYGYGRVVNGLTPPGVLTTITSPPVIGTPNGNDFPNGKVHSYTYSQGFADERLNRNLTSCIDGKGQTAWQVTYRTNQDPASIGFDAVGLIQRGPYRTKLVRVAQTPSPQNRFAVMRCIENDGLGNVAEYFYDSLNRLVTEREFTGRANPDLVTTDTQNRPTGKLRPNDPDFFETTHEWNADSLCTRTVHPRGDATEVVHQRAFNQNSSRSNKAKARLHDGDPRVIRRIPCCGGADLDGDGTWDITPLTTRLEFDERFGSPATAKSSGWSFGHGPRQSTSLDGSRTAPVVDLPGDRSGARIITDRDSGRSKGFGFVVSSTDPRGNVSTATYDERGNLLHTEILERKSGSVIHADYEYNARGQLNSITPPTDAAGCRQVDGYEYYDVPGELGYGFLKKAIKDKGGSQVCGTTQHFLIATSYEYDAAGNVVRCIDPRTNDWLFTYNSLDQLTTRTTPNSSFGTLVRITTTFTYDANDNLVQVDHENRDHTGALNATNPWWTSTYEFDALDRCTLIGHELTHTVQQGQGIGRRTFAYDANDNVVTESSPEAVNGNDPSNIVLHEYDERDLTLRTTRAPGTVIATSDEFDRDANGNCVRIRNGVATGAGAAAGAAVTLLTYDGFNRCVATTDAMGNVSRSAFDANGNLIWTRLDGETNDLSGGTLNRRLSETRHEYDSLDRRVRSRVAFFDIFTELAISDGESTTTFAYAPNDQLRSRTDDNGRVTRYGYDSAGRLASILDAAGSSTTYGYDANDNVTSVTQLDRSDITPQTEQRFTMTHEYDPLDRCVRSINNVGNTELFSYDSKGNLTRRVDPNGTAFSWEHDGLGRVTVAQGDVDGDGLFEPNEVLGTNDWDDNSRLRSSTDANGNRTTRFYDSLDRCITERFADNTEVHLVWSPRSNLILRQDANGTVVSNSYDLLDRCVRSDIAPGTGVAATTTFETFRYDGASRCIEASNNVSRLEFTHDSMGNREKHKADCLMMTATFDGEGNRLSLTSPSQRTVLVSYDAINQPTAMSLSFAGRTSLLTSNAYDGPGRLARMTRANGINTRVRWNGFPGSGQAADDFGSGQVLSINHSRTNAGLVVDSRSFSYDRAQNKTFRAQLSPFSTGGPLQTNSFAYNKLHRLQRSRVSGSVNDYSRIYVLDNNGNRQIVEENGVPATYQMDAAVPAPADFQMNQYSLTPFGALHYDANGNLISRDSPTGPTVLRYDYQDRLVSVERTVGPALVPIVSYTYDAFGRCISRTTHPPAPLSSMTTQFILDPDGDDDAIIEERENGQLRRSYAVPHVFEQKGRVMIPAGGTALYHHEDDLGNVLALTDGTGAIVERYEYDDFGVPRFLDSKGAPLTANGAAVTESPAGNPFLFRGMVFDGLTQLYRESPTRRPYSPHLGRALSGRWDGEYSDGSAFACDNPWSGGGGDGSGGSMRAGVSTSRSNIRTKRGFHTGRGDPIHGVDIKLGYSARAQGDPIHGVDIKLGYSARAQGDPVHGVDIKLGWAARGGGGGRVQAQYNPKEVGVDKSKVIVRGWDPEKKELFEGRVLKKEEGGRHTPFHNRTSFGILLGGHGGCDEDVVSPRDSGSGLATGRRWRPGRPVYGNITFEGAELRGHRDVGGYRLYGPGQSHWGSARLKTHHDVAMNSIRNMK